MTTKEKFVNLSRQDALTAQEQVIAQSNSVGLLRLGILGFIFTSASLLITYSTLALVMLVIPSGFILAGLVKIRK